MICIIERCGKNLAHCMICITEKENREQRERERERERDLGRMLHISPCLQITLTNLHREKRIIDHIHSSKNTN